MKRTDLLNKNKEVEKQMIKETILRKVGCFVCFMNVKLLCLCSIFVRMIVNSELQIYPNPSCLYCEK